MFRTIFAGLLAVLVAVYAPALFLDAAPDENRTDYLLVVRQRSSETPDNMRIDVSLETDRGIEQLPLEEYLVGVVLSEMPATFEIEALKAQAVAARTFALRQIKNSKHEHFDLCSNSVCCQAWTSKATIESKLGNLFDTYWSKAVLAVAETAGEAIYYEDNLIDAVYFSCSGGMTEDAVAVWGNDVPYLRGVSSPGEENSNVYTSEVVVNPDRFKQIMMTANEKIVLQGNPSNWFGAIERTKGSGVRSIEIGSSSVSGQEMRKLFGLKSTNFDVAVSEKGIVFSVRGYGHRVGMSQYGANAMAKSGKSYLVILQHYYSGVEIKKHP